MATSMSANTSEANSSILAFIFPSHQSIRLSASQSTCTRAEKNAFMAITL